MVGMKTDREIKKWLWRLSWAAVLGPLFIHVAYSIPRWFPELPDAFIWVTKWEPSDVLGYFGTILSAMVTVIILRITIINERAQRMKEALPKQIEDAETIILHECDCVEALIDICVAGKGYERMSSSEKIQFNAACDSLVTKECAKRVAVLSTSGADIAKLNQLFQEVEKINKETLNLLSRNIFYSTFSADVVKLDQMKVNISLLKGRIEECFSELRISSI